MENENDDTNMKARLLKIPPRVCLCSGLLMLAYVFSQYGEMWASQRRLSAETRGESPLMGTAHSSSSVEQSPIRLLIPNISLDAMVVEGTSRDSLLKGPGHLEDSAYPGEEGNFIVAAHRDTFFHRLDELELGDKIEVQRSHRDFRYYVISKTIVDADDTKAIDLLPDGRLTLITCYPTHYIGPAPRRLIVEARLLTP